MKLLAATLSTAALVVAPLSVAPAAQADAPSVHAREYRTCNALLRDWPSGVASSRKSARNHVKRGFERPAAGLRARRVFRANEDRLNRDGDGAICEQSRFRP